MIEGLKAAAARVWGRKTFITLVVLVAGTLVDIFSKNGLSTNLMSLMGVLAGAFTVGNSIENQAASKTTIAQIAAPQALNSEVGQKLDLANQSLATVMDTLSYVIKTTGLDDPEAYANKVAALTNPNDTISAQRAAANKVMNSL